MQGGEDPPAPTAKLTKAQQLKRDHLAEAVNATLSKLPRRISSVSKSVADLEASREVDAVDEVRAQLTEVRDMIEDTGANIDLLDKLDPGMTTEAKDALNKQQATYDDWWMRFNTAACTAKRLAREASESQAARLAAQTAGTLGTGPNTDKPRINNSLKPDLLRPDVPYDEFQGWKQQWQDYYTANDMQRMTVANQRTYLRSCMHDDLKECIDEYLGIGATAPVNVVIDRLTEYMQRICSIVQRRNTWYEFKQRSGENYREYFVRLKKTARLAEVSKMTYEDHLCAKLVAGIKDEELSCELLQMDNPKLEDAHKKCESWEASRATARQLTQAPVRHSAVNMAQPSTYKKNKQGKMMEAASARSGDQESSQEEPPQESNH